MLSGIIQGSSLGKSYISVTGGSQKQYISKGYSTGAIGKPGDMMYDLDSQCIKIFDGNSWQILTGNYASVELTAEASSILDWAAKKRDEEQDLEKLANENPAIKDLMDQIKMKQNQIKMVQTLIQKETTV